MKNIYIKFCVIIAIVGGLYSCSEDFLETSPSDLLTNDAVFNDPKLTRALLLRSYEIIPTIFTTGQILDIYTLDMTPVASAGITMNEHTAVGFWGCWAHMYAGIRGVNSFIAHVQDPGSQLEQADKDLFIAEARLLRAVFYTELYRLYRGVPIITEAQGVTEDNQEEWLVSRNTAEETVNFIITELEAVISELPVEWENDLLDYGRATKGAAYGLLARIALYEASLQNSQALYQKAAQAAEDVMNLKKGDGSPVYSLYPNYRDLFLAKKGDNNEEYIFFYDVTFIASWKEWTYFGGYTFYNHPPFSSQLPTQNLVDQFEYIDGNIGAASIHYDPTDPYSNRDSRFYGSMWHNDGELYRFYGSPIETWIYSDNSGAGQHYYINSNLATPGTGYYVKKGVDDRIDPNSDTWTGGHDDRYDPYLRYADVLLMYAEAANEVAASPTSAIYDAVNKVRNRAGQPDLPTGLTKDQMREKIRYERRIELCFEGSRYHDVRRWGIANTDGVSKGDVYRMKITKDVVTGNYTYTPEVYYTRKFEDKYILFPIPQEEIDKNSNLEQNPGF